MKHANPIVKLSFAFAIQIVKFSELLTANKVYVISNQLLRSGTSIGANIRESQNAESKADFIHKLALAQKECDETLYWLELLQSIKKEHKTEIMELHSKGTELLTIL